MSDPLLHLMSGQLASFLLHGDKQRFVRETSTLVESQLAFGADHSALDVLIPLFADALPRPTNGFAVDAPQPFKRNDPCPCGSGKKVKQCCTQVLDLTLPPPQMVFNLTVGAMSNEQLIELAQVKKLPLKLMETVLFPLIDRRLIDVAILFIKQNLPNLEKLRNEHFDLMSMTFDVLADVGEDELRLDLMHQLKDLKRANKLQSLAYQRLAMWNSDQGNNSQAQDLIKKAIQADPDNIELPAAELTILGFTESDELIKARAHYWLARLRKKYDDDMPLIGFLQEVKQRGKDFFEEQRDLLDQKQLPTLGHEDGQAAFENMHRLFHALADEPLHGETHGEVKLGELRISPPSSVQRLANKFCKLVDAAVEGTLYEERFDSLPGYEALWYEPDPDWLNILVKKPELAFNRKVLLALMDIVYEAPHSGELLDTFIAMLNDMCRIQSVDYILDLDKTVIDIPKRYVYNQCFWDLMSSAITELTTEKQEETLAALVQAIMQHCDYVPSEVQCQLTVWMLKQNKAKDCIEFFQNIQPSFEGGVFWAAAMAHDGQIESALTLIQAMSKHSKSALKSLKECLLRPEVALLAREELIDLMPLVTQDDLDSYRQWLGRNLPG